VSGDATGTTSFKGNANVSIPLTLATVNTNVGTYGSSTLVSTVTVNAKGLVTAVSNTAIAFPVTSVGGSTGAVTGGTFTGTVVFSGQSTAITQPYTDNSTNIATTAFVNAVTTAGFLSLGGGTLNGDLNIANTTANYDGNNDATRLHVDAYTNGVLSSRFSIITSPQPFSLTGVSSCVYDMFGGGVFQVYANTSPSSMLWVINMPIDTLTGNNQGGNISFVPQLDGGMTFGPAAIKMYRGNSVCVFGNTITTVTQPSYDFSTNVATTAFVKSLNYVQAPIVASGDASGTSLGNTITLTLPSITTAGTFSSVIVNSKGLVTAGVNSSITGDVSGTYVGNSVALTLATVNSNVGTFGTSTSVPTLTVNAKGLVTAVTNTSIAFPVTSVGGSTGAVTGGTFTSLVALTGQATAVTQPSSDNTSNVATTLFVKNANATQIGRYVVGSIGAGSGTYVYGFSVGVPVPSSSWNKLWTASITPSSTSSKILVEFGCTVSVSTAMQTYFVLTRGSTVIGMTGLYSASATNPAPLSLFVFDSPNTTSSTTYTCYYAQNVAGTTYINQLSITSFGGAMTSNYYLQDI